MTHHENQCGYEIRASQGASTNIYEAYLRMELGKRVRHKSMHRESYWYKEGAFVYQVRPSKVVEFVPIDMLDGWYIVPKKETVGDLVEGDAFECHGSQGHPMWKIAFGYVDLRDRVLLSHLDRRLSITYLGHIDSIDPAVLLGEEGS